MYCNKCGKEISNESTFCRYCGTQVKKVNFIETNNINTGIRCLKCNSNNINIQREQTANIGIAHTNYYNTKRHHGLIYFCFISWWIWIYKLIFLPFTILFGSSSRRKVGISNSISTNKTINKTVAVCQNCGYVWNVK